MFEKTILKNGLRIITVPQKTSQTVTVFVLVGTGSKNERKEINGISHFLEHMTFKGTKKRPTYLEVAETMDKVGGVFNAFTSEDCTAYYAKVESSQFELSFDWVSDIFLNSALSESEIEKEKGVISEEINMIYDHPMNYIGDLWLKVLYGDQPAGRHPAGTKETVLAMDRKKLADYRKRQYSPGHTVLCISGNFNPKSAEKLAKEYFSKIKDEGDFEKEKVIDTSINSASILSGNRKIENQNAPQCLVEYRKTDQSHLILGVRSYNIFHPKRYVQDVLETVLGGMMSSRLFVEVREKLGLAYYVRTEAEANPDTGFLATRAGVDNLRADKAIAAILKEYKKIADKKISAAELKKAKNNIKGKLAIALESPEERASFYGEQELFENKILTIREVFKEIDKVSQNDILKVSKDIFQPQNLNLALIGPFEDKNNFQDLLNNF